MRTVQVVPDVCSFQATTPSDGSIVPGSAGSAGAAAAGTDAVGASSPRTSPSGATRRASCCSSPLFVTSEHNSGGSSLR